jgi:hypothetical protein
VSLPKPDAFNRDISHSFARMTRLYADLRLHYASAYEASLQPKVGEKAGKVTSSEVPDPTGSVGFDHPKADKVSAHARIRRAMERIPRHLADAENALKAAESELLSSMDRLDPREGFTPLRFPVTASAADLEESKAAQARRKEAGEVV